MMVGHNMIPHYHHFNDRSAAQNQCDNEAASNEDDHSRHCHAYNDINIIRENNIVDIRVDHPSSLDALKTGTTVYDISGLTPVFHPFTLEVYQCFFKGPLSQRGPPNASDVLS